MGTKMRFVVFLVIVAIGVYVTWNVVPPRFHNSQLQDDLDDIVRRASYSTITEDDIKRMVITKAQADDIPTLKEDQITIVRSATTMSISVHYRVHVDLIVYQTDMDFTANSHNKIITG